ncbi:hypothetical protein HGRIS_006269 [Hohenbuehelia grisea]|uniref:DUF6533 domain-containing protein n=1 Tax=Hohenbuehelia grisea TaxID=104357 RepID=A0ABR3JZC0_9AGAR
MVFAYRGRYSLTAVYAVQIYDWLLNLGDEIELIHNARWTSIKVAYLLCRYLPLLTFPMYLWAWLLNHTKHVCEKIIHPLYGCLMIYQLSAQAVILIRAYAFTGRNKWVLAVLSTCYLAIMGAEIWLFGSRFVVPEEIFFIFGTSGCFGNDAGAQKSGLFQFHFALQTGMVVLGNFLLDLLMTIVVVVHCFRMGSVQGRLGKAFLFQGLTAFIVMAALNLMAAVLYLRPDRRFNGIGLPFLVLSDVLACHLILDLRRRVSPTEEDLEEEQSRIVHKAFDPKYAPDRRLRCRRSVDQWAC